MKISERTLRISAATFLSLLAVGVAYVVSGPNIFSSKTANAESTQEVLQAYATKDTDADGLPDWEEALYGTDPNKAISNSFGIPDGQAAKEGKLTPNALSSQLAQNEGSTTLTDADFGGVPAPAAGSLTEQFSHQFMQAYVQASNGQPMSADDQQALVSQLLQQFSAKAAATFNSSYSAVAVHSNASVSIASYAASVETVLTENDLPADQSDPLALMSALIEKDDSSAKPKVQAVSKAYGAMAKDMRAVQVPPSLVAVHVSFVQSLDQLSASTNAVSDYKSDPLATLGALSIFTQSSKQFGDSISSLATTILQTGEPQTGEPGELIVALARTAQTHDQ